jgi:hypothetical protein
MKRVTKLQEDVTENLSKEMILIDILKRIYKEFQSFDGYVASFELVGAAASSRETKGLIDSLEVYTTRIPEEIIVVIEEQFLTRAAKIHRLALQLKQEFLLISSDELKVKTRVMQLKGCRFHDNPVTVDDLWSILDSLDLKEETLSFILFIIESDWIPKLVEADLIITSHSSFTNLQRGSQNTLELAVNMIELCKFISNHIFSSSHRPTEDFSNSLIRKFRSLLDKNVALVKEDQIPDLENLLFELEFVDETFTGFREIFNGMHSLLERRVSTLIDVKEILESGDFNTVQVSDGLERGNRVI